MGELTHVEYLIAHKTAQEYRDKGYDVIPEARLDFFPGYAADLLVLKDGQAKVIEVKTRTSLAGRDYISKLAKIIEEKRGWSFELILVGEPHKLDSHKGARSFKGEGIYRLIKESRKSLEAGFAESAFMLAWSAMEATVRELLTEEIARDDTITTPLHVLDLGVFNGILSMSEYESLDHLRKYRNAIVHGFSADGFGEDAVHQLFGIIDDVVAFAEEEDDDVLEPAH